MATGLGDFSRLISAVCAINSGGAMTSVNGPRFGIINMVSAEPALAFTEIVGLYWIAFGGNRSWNKRILVNALVNV